MTFPVKSIGIVGGGVVGHATARVFMEFAEVRVYDVLAERRTHSHHQTLSSDIVFVCLPTPQNKSGLGCDLTALVEFFGRGDVSPSSVNYVLRSTVPVGTTRLLASRFQLTNLCHSPEFLTARCSVTDAHVPSRNIVGIPEGTLTAETIRQTTCYDLLIKVYQARFPGIAVLEMGSDESEMTKLALNSFFAVKLAYFNEVYAAAKKLGVDWESVVAGVVSDGRVAHSHTKVPGPVDGKRGFGGNCLPKDIANLIDCVEVAGATAPVMRAALERNKLDRGDVK